MDIVCVICSDFLTPSADIFHTPCGHIFHYACLTQWLQRSKSCPQCRKKTTSHEIHRAYFSFSYNDTITEDLRILQDKVDKLSLENMNLKKKLVKQNELTERIETYKKKLEEDIMILKSEKMALQNEFRELKKNTPVLKRAGISDFNIGNNSDGNVEKNFETECCRRYNTE